MTFNFLIGLLGLTYFAIFFINVNIYRNFDLVFFTMVAVIVQVVLGAILLDTVIINSVQARASSQGIFLTKIATVVILLSHILIEIFFTPLRKVGTKLEQPEAVFHRCANGYYLSPHMALFLIMFMGACVMILFGGFPQKYLFSNLTASDLAFLRVSELHSSSSVASLIKNAIVFNLSILTSFILYIYNRETNRFGVACFISVLIAIYVMTYDLSKSKVIWYLICLYAIKVRYDYLLFGLRSLFRMFSFFVLAFCVLVFFFSLTLPDLDYSEIFLYIFARTAVSQISGAPHFFDQDFNTLQVVSRHILEALQLADFEAPGQIVMSTLYPVQYSKGTVNFISVPAGYESIAIFGLIIGCFVYLIVYFLFRLLFLFRENEHRGVRIFSTALSGYVVCNSNLSSSILPFVFSVLPVIPVLLLLVLQRFQFLRKISLRFKVSKRS